MTKNDLKQLYWLTRDIAKERERLKELECAAAGTAVRLTGMPFASGEFSKTEYFAEMLAEQKELLRLKIETATHEYARINRYICSVPDSRIRLIMIERFLEFRSWQYIAHSMGGRNTADGVRKMLERYLSHEE